MRIHDSNTNVRSKEKLVNLCEPQLIYMALIMKFIEPKKHVKSKLL